MDLIEREAYHVQPTFVKAIVAVVVVVAEMVSEKKRLREYKSVIFLLYII